MSMIRALTLALVPSLLIAAPALAGPAEQAEPGVEATQVSVDLAHLDLSSVAGQRALHHRLHAAAVMACVDAGSGLSTSAAYRMTMQCQSSAMDRANLAVTELTRTRNLAMH